MFAPSLQGIDLSALRENDSQSKTSSPSKGRAAIRRNRVTTTRGPNGRIAGTKTITPHTLAASDRFLFVLARSAGANYIVRVPMAALKQLLGLPKNFDVQPTVLDIDPQTTDFDYAGTYPKFLRADDGIESTEE